MADIDIKKLTDENEALTLENKKIRAENEKLRAKLAPTKQVKDELKDSLKKKGKGLYCVEPFMNGGKTYNPGMAVTPANIGGNAKEPSAQLIKRLIAADVLFEVK